jgi:chemotaxis signal transduction protein
MSAEPGAGAGLLPAQLPLLLFHAAGAALGVEAGQVAGVLDAEQARRAGLACRDLAALLGVAGASEGSARLVLAWNGGQCGIGIDSLDELVTVPAAALQPLPEPLRQFRAPRAFWGGIVRGGRVVLLVDVERLLEPTAAICEAL